MKKESDLIKGLRELVAPKFLSYEEQQSLLDNAGELIREAKLLSINAMSEGEIENSIDIQGMFIEISLHLKALKEFCDKLKTYKD